MAYMVRLGMWGQGTPFKTFNDFISAVEKRYIDYHFRVLTGDAHFISKFLVALVQWK